MEIDSIFVYHCVDPALGIVIFREKEEATEYWDTNFEIGVETRAGHYYRGFRKISCRSCLHFLLPFSGDQKRIAFKSSLDSFNLSTYVSVSGKDTHLVAVVS